MTRHALSIFIISSFLGSLVYECIWFAISRTKFYFICSINKHDGEPHFDHTCKWSSEPVELWTIISMTLLGFWTLFWNALLIIILQLSDYVEKSPLFLLQQSVLMSFIVWSIATVFVLIFQQDSQLNHSTNLVIRFMSVPLMIQISLFCIFLGLYYLTYREDGSMHVVFGFKIFIFLLVIGLSAGLAQGVSLSIALVIVLTFSLILLLIITFCRRGRMQQNKLTNWTTWSFFIFSTLPC